MRDDLDAGQPPTDALAARSASARSRSSGVSRSRSAGRRARRPRAGGRAARDVRVPAVAAEAEVDDVGRAQEQRVRAAAVAVGDDHDERRRRRRSRPSSDGGDRLRRDHAGGRSAGRATRLGARRDGLVAGLAEPGVEAAAPLAQRSRARRRAASARTSSSGVTTSVSAMPGVGDRGRDRASGQPRRRGPGAPRRRGRAPSRDLAPSSAPTGMIATTRATVMRDWSGELAGRSPARRARPASSAMIVSVTSGAQPSAAIAPAERGVDRRRGRSRRPGRAYSRATPSALDSWPSEASIRSAGPLSALPPTIGLTATTGTPRARAATMSLAHARARPGSARSTRSGSTAR